uniref:Uncharacterized protein n=1 Tax=Nelumbo nucifera TaxID=4432 RepID=A0A822XCW3_NELNU|nr:TPA_asm: hypothetical protein HUJ06_019481 [Nelumbo nucifera]
MPRSPSRPTGNGFKFNESAAPTGKQRRELRSSEKGNDMPRTDFQCISTCFPTALNRSGLL